MTRCTVQSSVTVAPTAPVAPSSIFLRHSHVVLVVSCLDILLSVVSFGNSYKHKVHDEQCQSVRICLGTSGGSLAYHLFILPDGIKVRNFLFDSLAEWGRYAARRSVKITVPEGRSQCSCCTRNSLVFCVRVLFGCECQGCVEDPLYSPSAKLSIGGLRLLLEERTTTFQS